MKEKILKVGFIGLGLMGIPMASNISKKGFELTVFNRTREKTSNFKKFGVHIADSPKELALISDIVITMVTGPQDVMQVLFGSNGVVKSGKKGLIVIDMSTIGVKAAKRFGEKLKKIEMEFIDAPVTGSVVRAKSGELTIFVGGEEKVYKRVKKVLEAIGSNIQYMGPIGSGQAIKLINNSIIAAQLTALAEGMLLADTLKLSRKRVADVLSTTPLASPMINMKLPNMVNNNFPTAFSMKNHLKDLKLALEENNSLPLLKLVGKLYKKGVENGLSELDNSAILQVLEKSNK